MILRRAESSIPLLPNRSKGPKVWMGLADSKEDEMKVLGVSRTHTNLPDSTYWVRCGLQPQ
jgi:hypothetical protein